MLLKITSIDHNGYNGRNFEGDDGDIGTVVCAIKMESWYRDVDEEEIATVEPNGRVSDDAREAGRLATLDDGAENLVYMWTCVTPDGRVLELMDHEVEMFRS